VHLKDITGSLGTELTGKRIALCLTASISITEAPRIARLLMRHGADVRIIMTPKAAKFISPMIFEWSTGNAPITKLTGKVEHVELVSSPEGKADLFLIAPCTANTLAKIASGISDEPVSSTICTALGSGIPILIASAMHEPMLRNPILQDSKKKLMQLGVKFIEGKVVESKSKLASPEEIVHSVISALGGAEESNSHPTVGSPKFNAKTSNEFVNIGFVITAGATREPIDDVRFITNASTGKMGISLAEEALSRGAKNVCLVHGIGTVAPDFLKEARVSKSVKTTEEMLNAVLAELSKKGKYDVFISAAAPADFSLQSPARGKISTADQGKISIQLLATKKIVRVIKEKFPSVIVVAFKALYLTKNVRQFKEKTMEALESTGADIVVGNDVARSDIGFGSDYNEVYIVTKSGRTEFVPRTEKRLIAKRILDVVLAEKLLLHSK
jgi:phosphopantothenoylcysteine decarboxylase / phosphopantothenate---cysteine ligase